MRKKEKKLFIEREQMGMKFTSSFFSICEAGCEGS